MELTQTEQASTETHTTGFDLGEAIDTAAGEVEARPRDEFGRFTKVETQEAAPEEPAVETELPDPTCEPEAVKPEAVPGLDAPASWSAAVKEEWANLPRSAQEEILRREKDAQTQFEQYANKLKAFDPIAQALEPVRQNIALSGITDAQYVSQLVNAARFIDSNPEQAIQWLCQQKGVDPRALIPSEEDRADLDPNIATLQQKIAQLESQITQGQQDAQQQQKVATQSEIDAFAVSHPHFEAVRQDMAVLVQAGRANGLDEAYNLAIRLNDDVWGQESKRLAEEAEAKRQAEAAEKARAAAHIARITPKATAPVVARTSVDPRGNKGIMSAIDEAADSII